MSNNAANDMSG